MEEKKQVIIAIGREYGSGGHVIAQELGKRFDIPVYNRNLLGDIAAEHHVDVTTLDRYDEIPKNRLLYRTVKGYSNSPQENIARLQFDYLKRLADEGKSFIVVGRCAETLLREYHCMTSVFVRANRDTKLDRICEKKHISREQAKILMTRKDNRRRSYHNYYCEGKWGDSRNYDLCINISHIGFRRSTDVVEAFVRYRLEMNDQTDMQTNEPEFELED